MKVIKHLINSIREAGNHNPEAEVRPHCILWPDKERQWENAVEKIMANMEELLILGDYKPTERKGPAIWLRAAIGECVEEYTKPYGRIPVLYLPGISRQDLRAVEQCPDELKPLAELQYRGVIWSQVNARDWTILAYLKTKNGGLGFDIAQDEATLQAMQRAITKILDEEIDDLKLIHLDKDFFNSLISGVDTVKDILIWMCLPDDFKAERSSEEWQAFTEICKSKYKFNPEQDGVFGAAEKLGWQDEAWDIVWNRFCEAPAKYQAIPNILRNTVMPIIDNQERFPQWNEQQENSLRKELLKLSNTPEQAAREEILRLETLHSKRREYVWAELGEAPLAIAMKWLSEIAAKTSKIINGKLGDIAKAQESWGWQVDYAVIKTLASVEKQEDIEAVMSAIRSVYLSWADKNSRNLQKVAKDNVYPCEDNILSYRNNECICFIDGLRFDLAKQLSDKLKAKGIKVTEKVTWAPIPTVTSTCKPALTSVAKYLTGDELQNCDFSPILKENNQTATSQRIVNLMEKDNWKIIDDDDMINEGNMGWFEFGSIDKDGHKMGWRIAQLVETYLNEATEKVEALFKAGWKSIRIVSDHGWLLMPKGLTKFPLEACLTDSKWGRCAAIKPGALFHGSYYPWYWNQNVNYALPDGIGCYRNGVEYSHGGISLQECLMLQLILDESEDVQSDINIQITDIMWKGMRCKIAVEGTYSGLKVDIRLKPALDDSSIVMGVKALNEEGITSLVVDDDTQEGKAAYIVFLNSKNNVVYQTATVVGGEI